VRYISMKKYVLTITLLTYLTTCVSQVALGEWRSHLPASNFTLVDEMGKSVFLANSSGVLVHNREDGSNQHLTKINSLVSEGISAFACSEQNAVCIVGYEDGNIDIITSAKSVYNQPALKNNFIVGNKRVNDIIFIDSTALLSTNIGLLKLDLKTLNINADRRFKVNNDLVPIQTSAVFKDSLFMASSLGIFKTQLSGIFDENKLEPVFFEETPSLVNQLFIINDQLFLSYIVDSLYFGDTLYRYTNNRFKKVDQLAGDGFKSIHATGSILLIAHPDRVASYDLEFNQTANIFTYGDDAGMEPRQAKISRLGDILIADERYGGIITTNANQYNPTIINISSPSVSQTTILNQIDDVIYAFPGGTEQTYNIPRIHVFEDDKWESFILSTDQYSTMRNTMGSVISDGSMYVGSAGAGIASLNDNYEITELYDYTNSTLQDLEPNIPYDFVSITDLTTSEDGTIYAVNYRVPEPLIIRHTNGEWESIPFQDAPSPKTSDITYTENGFLIFTIIDVGLIVYDTRRTHDDTSDDQYKLLTTSPSSGNLPSANVTCFAVDRDNELWIGTDAGIGVIYSIESVFNQNFDGAQKIIVSQDGFNGYLFETETVEAIAVDGANRKWVGTGSSGLFLISADGADQIHNFTTANSPLLDNKVSDLAIHPVSGEVFVASEKGLISYRSEATEPEPALEQLGVFPNPVKPGYSGLITIKNLTSNSYVRITDNVGNLIFETTSLGGQATWDGRNKQGVNVPSGVYLVFAATREGTGGQTSKVIILR
jgi:hypothetical protein